MKPKPTVLPDPNTNTNSTQEAPSVRQFLHSLTATHGFRTGDHVKIVKIGSQTGKTGVVTEPHWAGRIKIECDEGGVTKSYLPEELELHERGDQDSK